MMTRSAEYGGLTHAHAGARSGTSGITARTVKSHSLSSSNVTPFLAPVQRREGGCPTFSPSEGRPCVTCGLSKRGYAWRVTLRLGSPRRRCCARCLAPRIFVSKTFLACTTKATPPDGAGNRKSALKSLLRYTSGSNFLRISPMAYIPDY